jgi:hypothetical protein
VLHLAGAIILVLIIGGATLGYVGHVSQQVAANGTPGAKKVAKSSRKAASKGAHSAEAIWAEVRAADWLERRRNRRAARRAVGRGLGRGGGATARGIGRGTAATVRGIGRGGAATGRGIRRGLGAATRRLRNRGQQPGTTPAAAPVPVQPQPSASPAVQQPGRNPVPVTTQTTNGSAPAPGGGADLFTAIQQVTSHAMSGGLRSKQRAFKTLEDGFDYISQQLATFARQLSEPGQEYPASIWEPLATAAAHMKAASSAAGESSSGIGALAGMNLGEAADSPVHVPHNTQLNASP